MKEAIPQIQPIDNEPTKQEHKKSSDVLLTELVEMRSELLRYIENTFCRNSRNPKQEAEDIVQIAMMKASPSVHTFRGESSFRTWVYRVAENEARMYHRKKQSVKFGDRDPAKLVSLDDFDIQNDTKGEDPEMLTYGNEIKDIVADFLRMRFSKEPLKIAMFNLSMYEGLTYNEIGEKLNTPPGSVKSIVARAKLDLRTYLREKNISI
jgi:RNA polymerase sigma-70 factor, ECF subfamily